MAFKTGSFSLILKEHTFINYFNGDHQNQICKITNNNSDFEILKYIKSLGNYENYLLIHESEINILNKSSKFYKFIISIRVNDNPFSNGTSETLYYYFMKNGGSNDLHDSIRRILYGDFNVWKGKIRRKLKEFIRNILEGLKYLHDNKIGHFDIKPENIMISDVDNGHRFKLIDFGFADKYPFTRYLNNPQGTLEYFPRYCSMAKYDSYLPKLYPNDWHNHTHIATEKGEYDLVYKTDIYSFGRVLHSLFCVILERKAVTRLPFKFIDKMIEVDVYKRYTTQQCLDDDYFSEVETKSNCIIN